MPFTDFKEDFGGLFLCTLFNTASSAMHLSDSSVSEDAVGPNPGLLRLWHWQSGALTTGLISSTNQDHLIHNSARSPSTYSARSHSHALLDLIHNSARSPSTYSARSHSHTRLDLIHSAKTQPPRQSLSFPRKKEP